MKTRPDCTRRWQIAILSVVICNFSKRLPLIRQKYIYSSVHAFALNVSSGRVGYLDRRRQPSEPPSDVGSQTSPTPSPWSHGAGGWARLGEISTRPGSVRLNAVPKIQRSTTSRICRCMSSPSRCFGLLLMSLVLRKEDGRSCRDDLDISADCRGEDSTTSHAAGRGC
jgi:hypothetical protein